MDWRSFTAIVALLLISVAGLQFDASDAAEGEITTYYCYGDSPTLRYPYSGDDVVVTWSAVDIHGNPVMCFPDTGSQTALQLTGLDDVWVTQTVTRDIGGDIETDSKTIHLVGLHVFVGETVNDRYTVTFRDGDSVIATSSVDRTTVIEGGKMHIFVPLDPMKSGCAFCGWFLDTGYTQVFDPYSPVRSDMDVYAKWSGTSSTVIRVDTHIVTFESVNGIAYRIDRTVGSAIYFSVVAVPGFDIVVSSIEAVPSSGMLSSLGSGSYVLDRINQDVVVKISADQIHSIEYRLTHVSATFEGDSSLPSKSFDGPFDLSLSTDSGWSSMEIAVIMDGKDVTSQCVQGDRIHIEEITGDLVIIATADMPIMHIAISGVVIILILAALLLLVFFKKRKQTEDE